MSAPPVGRRERKKAATRQAIADAALLLFLERGFDAVNVRDIAEAADVSTTTLFKHFPSKEALLFDEDEARETRLVGVVRHRSAGQTVPQALRDSILATWDHHLLHPRIAEFEALTQSTPALQDYARRMNFKLEQAVTAAVAAEVGRPDDDPACRALVRFAFEAPLLARTAPDPGRALRQIFDLIEQGWAAVISPVADAALPEV